MYRKCYDVEKLKKYVNEGKSNVEIAYLLDISVATVIAGVKAYGLKGMRKRGRPKEKGIDTLRKTKTNEPSAAALIRAQGQQIRRETAWEYLQRRCGLRGDADGQEKTQPVTAAEERAGADR